MNYQKDKGASDEEKKGAAGDSRMLVGHSYSYRAEMSLWLHFWLQEITPTWKEVSALFEELGSYQERAYRMNPKQFLDLVGTYIRHRRSNFQLNSNVENHLTEASTQSSAYQLHSDSMQVALL